jgi:hypothetical protein
MNIHERKRAAYRERLRPVLQDILNDCTVMANEDCPDLIVSIGAIEFGKTVRRIYVDFHGSWKDPERARTAHERYLQQAAARGEDTYVDLTDVSVFPSLMEKVEEELQRRLGLSYRPEIRPLSRLLESGR